MGGQTKVMTDEWKALDAKKKKKYEDLAIKEKDRYEKEMKDAGLSKGTKKTDKDGGEGGPKRPTSSFFLYQAERREGLKKE
jgi:high mobility group protein B1